MATRGVHRRARAFSGAAAVYERTRPDYPPEVVRWWRDHAAPVPGVPVMDLAAGTGKLTRALAADGRPVVAVEPVEGMRETLARALPAVPVVAATAHALPLGTGTVGAVTVAQAFHWFADREALAEIHRVLGAGGSLTLVWNRRDLDDPLQSALEDLMRPWRGDVPAHWRGEWRRAFAAPAGVPALFAPSAELHVPWHQSVDVEGVVGRVASVSFVAAMDDADRVGLLDAVRAVAAEHRPPLVVPHVTDAYCYRRLDD